MPGPFSRFLERRLTSIGKNSGMCEEGLVRTVDIDDCVKGRKWLEE